MELTTQERKMFECALSALPHAHCKYTSKLRAAAIQTASGKIHTGVRFESVSYPATLTAVQAAVSVSVSQELGGLNYMPSIKQEMVACLRISMSDDLEIAYPAGQCLQSLVEHMKSGSVTVVYLKEGVCVKHLRLNDVDQVLAACVVVRYAHTFDLLPTSYPTPVTLHNVCNTQTYFTDADYPYLKLALDLDDAIFPQGIKPLEKTLAYSALKATRRSYVPRSRLSVGAAMETDIGIFTGCNVETAVLCGGVCAEGSALCNAVRSGAKKINILAVTCLKMKDFIVPCGICRQQLSEFGEFPILLVKISLEKVVSVEYLDGDKPFSLSTGSPIS